MVEKLKVKGCYLHIKTDRKYKLLFTGTDSETLVDVAIYQAMYGTYKIWVRPLNMFLDGRFRLIE